MTLEFAGSTTTVVTLRSVSPLAFCVQEFPPSVDFQTPVPLARVLPDVARYITLGVDWSIVIPTTRNGGPANSAQDTPPSVLFASVPSVVIISPWPFAPLAAQMTLLFLGSSARA